MSIKSYRSAVTDVSATATDLGEIGERREEKDGGVFILVKGGDTTVTAFRCLTVSAFDAAANEITLVAASPTDRVAGVNSGAGSVAAESFFWMQIGGVASCFADAGGVAIGDPVAAIGTTTDGWVESYVNTDALGIIGVGLQAKTSAEVKVLLQLG